MLTFPAVLTLAAFTRPADTTPYASGDLVANSTTAGSVVAPIFEVGDVDRPRKIIRARLTKSGVSVTNASFRMHFYNAPPTPANGDNGAWSTNKAANYVGSIDVTIDKAFTDGATGVAAPTNPIVFKPETSTDNLYCLLEARGAYTPVSAETFTPSIELE